MGQGVACLGAPWGALPPRLTPPSGGTDAPLHPMMFKRRFISQRSSDAGGPDPTAQFAAEQEPGATAKNGQRARNLPLDILISIDGIVKWIGFVHNVQLVQLESGDVNGVHAHGR